MSFDPVRGLLFANTNNLHFVVILFPRDEYQKMRENSAANRVRVAEWVMFD